jgi:hypothetical protein
MRPPLVALALLSLVAAAAGCGECIPDCADGYAPVPDSCSCRLIHDAAAPDNSTDTSDTTDAGAGETLASCRLGTNTCGTGSTCIQGCPNAGSLAGVCSVPGRDTCGCGAVLDPCDTPGTVCLMPACCDYRGICVTPAERAAICARHESGHFDCAAASP